MEGNRVGGTSRRRERGCVGKGEEREGGRRRGWRGTGEWGRDRGGEGKGWTRTGETLMPFSPFFIFIICV